MPSLFRRQTAPPVEEEEISAELLDALPEMGSEFPSQQPAKSSASELTPEDDVSLVLIEVRRQMEAAFAQQLDRVESTFAGVLKDMEKRINNTNAELAAARQENQRVRADHDHKVEALRALKKTLENL